MLKKNDIVDVVSIGTPCNISENEKMKKFLQKHSLQSRIFLEKEVSIAKNQDHEFATISAKTRFEHFKKAINSDSKIIWCSRGGYGSAEILPFLQKMPKPKNKKILIGFSDISSVANFLAEKWDWKIICAPMLIQLALDKVSKKSQDEIINLLFGKTKKLQYKLKQLTGAKQEISGIIDGGCVSVLCGNFGTKNQINWKGKILFLEDEGEDGERLDRYFYQISTIIKETKNKPAVIILGNFLQGNPHGTPQAKNIEIAIERLTKNLKEIAIYQEKSGCLGHSQNMLPLLLNTKITISKNNLLQQTDLFI